MSAQRIDWARYHTSASVEAVQECTIDEEGIDWGSVEVTGTLTVHIFDKQRDSAFVASVDVENLDDEAIVDEIAAAIQRYESNLIQKQGQDDFTVEGTKQLSFNKILFPEEG